MLEDNEIRGLAKGLVWVVVLVILLTVIAVPVGWAFRWFETPFRVTEPDRVERLSRQANEMYQQLKAQKNTILANKARLDGYEVLYGIDRTKWPQGKQAEYQQLFTAQTSMINGYNGLCGQYMALWNDEWRDIPAPDDLSKTCEYLQ